MRGFLQILKWVVAVGFVMVLVCGGAAAFIWPKVDEAMRARAEAERGPEVRVEPAALGSLTRVVSAPGSVTALRTVNISSRVSAKIVSLPFEAGDEVAEGDVIVSLDSKDLEARLEAQRAALQADEAALKAAEASYESARASIDGVRASYDKALADLERSQDLFESGDVSAADLDAAETEAEARRAELESRRAGLLGSESNVEAARARVAVAQAGVDQAQENLEYATIRSPIDGVITKVNSREGEVALGTISNQGAIILQIADLSEMLVNARIAEVDIARVRDGQSVKIYINGYPDETFTGTLRRTALENTIGGDGTSYFDAEIALHLDEGRRIFAGLTANVDVEVETLDDIVVVPSQAVVDRRVDEIPMEVRRETSVIDDSYTFTRAVFVYDGEAREVRLRPVRLAASNLRDSAIAEGLEQGEQIVVGPFRSLRDLGHDTEVRLMEDEDAGAEAELAGEDGGEGDGDDGGAEGDDAIADAGSSSSDDGATTTTTTDQ